MNENNDLQADISADTVSGNDVEVVATVSENGVSVSSGNVTDEYTDIAQESTENESTLSTDIIINQQELIQSVNDLNGTLIILLFFIIFSWCEKKIKNSVKKVVHNDE